jgi:predicted Zn-dependent protease
MAVAGYDPAEAPRFWERMGQASGGKAPPEFMSTHPSHETRTRDLIHWQDEVKPLFQASSPAAGGNSVLPDPSRQGVRGMFP